MAPADPPTGEGRPVVETEQSADEPIVETVARALAATKNVPVTDLESLYSHVETDALERIVSHAQGRASNLVVAFGTSEYVVVVTQRGQVRIHRE